MSEEKIVSKVLIVDDEQNVLNACVRLLRNEPFEVLATSSQLDALQYVREMGFAVIVTDQRMPGMEGVELLEKVREISPDTIRLMLTGYADIQAAIAAINKGSVYRFMTKPWDDEDLKVSIRRAVEQYELVTENKRLQEIVSQQNEELKGLNQNLEEKVFERTEEISRLVQQLQQSVLGSTQVLAGLAEIHSPLVGSHSKRVAAVVREVAIAMEIGGRELFEVETAAMLHDIGKLMVPEDILKKTVDMMTGTELAKYQDHVIKGELIALMVPNLGDVPVMIRHHHERWDGGGYPDHLRDVQIPLGSRLIAVVDAYDNILNRRSDFEHMTTTKALSELQKKCLTELDQKIVAKLTSCVWGRKADLSDDVEIHMRDLKPGMILSRDLRTAQGVLLLAKGGEVKAHYLERFLEFQKNDPFVDNVCVYRSSLGE